MRCPNCGWPNKPGASTCVKCNSSLSAGSNDSNIAATVATGGNYGGGYQAPAGPDPSNLNMTVRENEVFGGGAPVPPPISRQEEHAPAKSCVKCGYPLRPGTEKCPNCQFPVNGAHAEEKSNNASSHNTGEMPGRQVSSTRLNSNSPLKGTVNPYMMNLNAEPTFILKPIKRIDERHEFEDIEFEGAEVVLKRDNTDANNPSITSREQAVISHKDGQWYIEDRSEQKTTFVQASHKIELNDGDIILLGNRLFEFRK